MDNLAKTYRIKDIQNNGRLGSRSNSWQAAGQQIDRDQVVGNNLVELKLGPVRS